MGKNAGCRGAKQPVISFSTSDHAAGKKEAQRRRNKRRCCVRAPDPWQRRMGSRPARTTPAGRLWTNPETAAPLLLLRRGCASRRAPAAAGAARGGRRRAAGRRRPGRPCGSCAGACGGGRAELGASGSVLSPANDELCLNRHAAATARHTGETGDSPEEAAVSPLAADVEHVALAQLRHAVEADQRGQPLPVGTGRLGHLDERAARASEGAAGRE